MGSFYSMKLDDSLVYRLVYLAYKLLGQEAFADKNLDHQALQ